MSIPRIPLLLGLACVATGPVLAAAPGDTLARAVSEAQPSLDFRYRYEFVDQDSFDKDANAQTLRTRLTLSPKLDEAWSLLLEVDDVRRLGSVRFNDTRNGGVAYPQVLDPKGTDLNQMWVRYTGFADLELTAGRQRIQRANDRFVGNVGWRQNEQTYDAFNARWTPIEDFSAHYAYVTQVNRIFGPETGSPAEDLDSNTHLVDVQYALLPQAVISAYAYLMDFRDSDALSNATYGARLTGTQPVAGEWQFAYAAEFARQDDYADNPVDYDANYWLVEAGIAGPLVGLRIGHEVFEGGSGAGSGFRTPLATLHAFQGWADKFTGVTGSGSSAGIEDFYVAFTAKLLGGQWTLVWHDYSAETGSDDLGDEIDVSAAWQVAQRYGVMLKAARYDADTFADDTTKLWLMLTADF